MNKGRDSVGEKIKRARSSGIFIILIILDNPAAEKSITDIKVGGIGSVTGSNHIYPSLLLLLMEKLFGKVIWTIFRFHII